MLSGLTKHLQQKIDLNADQIRDAVHELMAERATVSEKADFLTALTEKGESTEELTWFALEVRQRAVELPIAPLLRGREIIDVCGMGGDRLGTFNISTTVSLLVAAAGIPVAKHGNRAVTSKAGSADVLEALGIAIDLGPEAAAASLLEHHFAFLFAPRYHPAFRSINPARQLCAAQGRRTIFNLLGPLLNPVRPSVQLVGVPRRELCEPMARVLQAMGLRRAMVVCGGTDQGGLDELSILGENWIAEFYQERGFTVGPIALLDGFAFQPCSLSDLAGGDREANAAIIRSILEGRERGPKREAVLLNAGAALFVAGRVRSLLEGWELAEELIDSGQGEAKLAELAQAKS